MKLFTFLLATLFLHPLHATNSCGNSADQPTDRAEEKPDRPGASDPTDWEVETDYLVTLSESFDPHEHMTELEKLGVRAEEVRPDRHQFRIRTVPKKIQPIQTYGDRHGLEIKPLASESPTSDRLERHPSHMTGDDVHRQLQKANRLSSQLEADLSIPGKRHEITLFTSLGFAHEHFVDELKRFGKPDDMILRSYEPGHGRSGIIQIDATSEALRTIIAENFATSPALPSAFQFATLRSEEIANHLKKLEPSLRFSLITADQPRNFAVKLNLRGSRETFEQTIAFLMRRQIFLTHWVYSGDLYPDLPYAGQISISANQKVILDLVAQLPQLQMVELERVMGVAVQKDKD